MNNSKLDELVNKFGVVIFTKNDCPRCRITKKVLSKQNKKWYEINISQKPDAIPFLKQEGFASTPVVFTNQTQFSGFRPDQLSKI